ncbi:MAG TPA: DUF1064 domain-containing protein [Planctomycetota bacterium]|nr:DUF1064 domain-containing protein [Planctomycetota bacterium]
MLAHRHGTDLGMSPDTLAAKPQWVRDQVREICNGPESTPVPKSVNKYHNEHSVSLWPEMACRRFDSKLERARAEQLCALSRANEISDLQFQPHFELTTARIGYRADFAYIESGRKVVEEVKGMETERWKIIRKLWRFYGPAVLRIYRRGYDGRPSFSSEILPLSSGSPDGVPAPPDALIPPA